MHVPSLNQDFVSRFGLAPFYYTIILLFGFEASEVILGYDSQNIKMLNRNYLQKMLQKLFAKNVAKTLQKFMQNFFAKILQKE